MVLFMLISCKTKNTNNAEETTKDSIISKQIPAFSRTDLPVGKIEILSKEINTKEHSKSIEILKYFSNSFGKSSLDSNEIFSLIYKPSKSDTLNPKEIGVLKSTDDYSPFVLNQILSKKSNYECLIFEGQSVTSDYDGNEIVTPRKDLIIYDSKQNKIIDEMNLYFDYTDGIVAQTKLYFIDEDYNIFLRYYKESEEGNPVFSPIKKFVISELGKLESVK